MRKTARLLQTVFITMVILFAIDLLLHFGVIQSFIAGRGAAPYWAIYAAHGALIPLLEIVLAGGLLMIAAAIFRQTDDPVQTAVLGIVFPLIALAAYTLFSPGLFDFTWEHLGTERAEGITYHGVFIKRETISNPSLAVLFRCASPLACRAWCTQPSYSTDLNLALTSSNGVVKIDGCTSDSPGSRPGP